jgi:hypothetical protein
MIIGNKYRLYLLIKIRRFEMKDLKKYAAIILILFVATSISAQTYNLKGWATTTGSGTLTQGNWGMFATFGQPAAGMATQGNYTLYMGIIRPSAVTRFSISGYVNYYRGTFPAVSNTEMCLSNGGVDTVLTDGTGYYDFSSVLAYHDYEVKPRKINAANNPAVSSYDAALVLRHAAQIDTLDTLQVIAGDVSGNGSISAYDAGLILQYVVGFRHHFPAGYRPGEDTVDWAFRPPTRSYNNLSSNQTDQNFRAILYGDPSGNWSGDFFTPKLASQGPNGFLFVNLTDEINTAPISNSQLSNSETQLVMNKPDNTIEQSAKTAIENSKLEIDNSFTTTAELSAHSITYPIEIKDAKDLVSLDLQVSYELNLKPITIKTTETTKDFLVAGTDYNGALRIGIAGALKLNGNVKVMEIVFASKEEVLANPDIRIDWLIQNEGEEALEEQDAVMGNNEPYYLFLLTGKPNPFADEISIRYAVPKTTKLDIKIYNSSGQVVKTLVNETKNYGQYTIIWNGSDEMGKKLTNGIYFIQMTADGMKRKEKVILTK